VGSPNINLLLFIVQFTVLKSSHVVPIDTLTVHIVDTKQTPWPLVRKRTIPTDRPPLVDEI
jgi:hypothetical protein